MSKPRKRVKAHNKRPAHERPRRPQNGHRAANPDTQTIRAAGGRGSNPQLPDGADSAVRLLTDIKDHTLDPRDLSPPQRRSCLLLMANGTQTSGELAALFKVAATTIRKDMQAIRRELGREVAEWTLEEVLGQVTLAADVASAHAMRQEDPALMWTIQRDYAKLLKELGVVGPRDDRHALTLTVEGLGDGYERARRVLSAALDPRLTGEQPDEDPHGALPLERRFHGDGTPSWGLSSKEATPGGGDAEVPEVSEDQEPSPSP